MHFKSAVILCAMYSFTSIWSTGLNRYQIKDVCITLYENRHDNICIKDFPYVIKTVLGIQKNPENVFIYDPDELDYINFNKLFLALSYEDKTLSDTFEDKMLTGFEVDFYLKMFIRDIKNLNQPGYLTRYQLSVVFDHLCLNVKEKENAEKLANEIIGGDNINIAKFLLIMFEILPEGNGLSQAQIEEFVKLYTLPKTNSHCIDPLKIQSIFKEFHMATKPYEDLMLFESNRPAAKELMELMIVTAERSRTVHENKDKVLSTKEVRSLLSIFAQLDTDNDGILSKNEAQKFLEGYHPNVSTYNFNDKEINVAEYLLFNLYKKLGMGLDIVFIMNKLQI